MDSVQSAKGRMTFCSRMRYDWGNLLILSPGKEGSCSCLTFVPRASLLEREQVVRFNNNIQNFSKKRTKKGAVFQTIQFYRRCLRRCKPVGIFCHDFETVLSCFACQTRKRCKPTRKPREQNRNIVYCTTENSKARSQAVSSNLCKHFSTI